MYGKLMQLPVLLTPELSVCALYRDDSSHSSRSLSLSCSRRMRWQEEAATSTAASAASWRLDEDDDGVDYAAVMAAPTSTYNGRIFKLMAQLFRLPRRFSDYLH